VKAQIDEANLAAPLLGIRLMVLYASSRAEFEAAFAALAQQRGSALMVSGNPLFVSGSDELVALASRYAVPTIYQHREAALAGGLMSYGASLPDTYRLVGSYVARILKGEKPADLPMQQAVKVELIINLKTANSLGLAIPERLLATADEVIQ
jgi:putative tryptophan/tyrosine transport system substrate-binding protein